MLYYVLLSTGSALSYNANTPQNFPANLTKSATSSVSPKQRSVSVPFRLEEAPLVLSIQ